MPSFISGPVMPGVFARDRVSTTGTSIPGGTRILSIIGEGKREETLVASAVGGGQDGFSPDFSGTANPDGRHFLLSNSPVITNRTELFLNGIPLVGLEAQVNNTDFDQDFDFRIDSPTGKIELQSAKLVDQGGALYIEGSSNFGDGYLNILEVADKNAPAELWTLRCIGVTRDAYGEPIQNTETFTLTGTVSGQIRTSTGQPILFKAHRGGNDGYYDVDYNYLSSTDGYFATPDNNESLGFIKLSAAGTSTFILSDSGGFLQAAPGDTITIPSIPGTPAYTDFEALITTVHNDKVIEIDTPIGLTTSNINAINLAGGFTVNFTAPQVLNVSSNTFTASDIGLSVRGPLGDFVISGVIVETTPDDIKTVRLTGDTFTVGTSPGVPWTLFQTNGLINVSIFEGLLAFDIGDRFDFEVSSKKLNQNDELVARYIAEADLNVPEFFTEVAELYAKHGRPSTTNSLSLGAQLAFTNGAPGIFTVQAKPSLARRTNKTLLLVTDGTTAGSGFNGDTTDPELDTLRFPFPKGEQPDVDTDVHIFISHRNSASGDVTERQIFPNKHAFFDSANATLVGQQSFVDSNAYSYTVIVDNDILQFGSEGTVDSSKAFQFRATDAIFTSRNAVNPLDVGDVIRLTGGAKADDTRFDSFDSTIISSSDISSGLVNADGSIVLRITRVINSTTVQFDVEGVDLTTSPPYATQGTFGGFLQDLTSVDWQLIDAGSTDVVTSSLLISKDLVTNGTVQRGDGIRVTYVDAKDADFFDPNWLEAYEALELADVQMVVPLPLQTISAIQRVGVTHVESQSYIQTKQERILLTGAPPGVTPAALLGQKLVAVEDIGVIEGIQGATPEDVLSGNIEDLADYSIVNNFGNTNRVAYFWPDEIVVNVGGSLTKIPGFYIASAAGGWFANNQNVAEPLTNKSLSGFTILSDKVLKKSVLNSLSGIGVSVLQPIVGGGKVLWGKTTTNSGFPEDEELSIMFIRDRVKKVMRDSLSGLIGTVENSATAALMTTRVANVFGALVSQGLVIDYTGISVSRDKIDGRLWNIRAKYKPAAPVNGIFIDLEVSIS